jgi:hypothetical protein
MKGTLISTSAHDIKESGQGVGFELNFFAVTGMVEISFPSTIGLFWQAKRKKQKGKINK